VGGARALTLVFGPAAARAAPCRSCRPGPLAAAARTLRAQRNKAEAPRELAHGLRRAAHQDREVSQFGDVRLGDRGAERVVVRRLLPRGGQVHDDQSALDRGAAEHGERRSLGAQHRQAERDQTGVRRAGGVLEVGADEAGHPRAEPVCEHGGGVRREALREVAVDDDDGAHRWHRAVPARPLGCLCLCGHGADRRSHERPAG